MEENGYNVPSTSQNPSTVNQFIDEQGRTLYIEDPYFYEQNGSTVVYGQTYEALPQEVYQEEIVGAASYGEDSVQSDPRPTNKTILVKDSYPHRTVLLTAQSLEAENASLVGKAGKRATRDKAPSDPKRLNQEGSSLNKNMPGMRNMFKVITESALKKTETFLKQIEDQEIGRRSEEAPMQVAREEEVGEEDDEDIDVGSDTPPTIEKIGMDGSEFPEPVFDQWPLYSNTAIDFKEACELLIGITPIDEEKVCKTLPMQFKHEGTFLIDTTENRDVLTDGNGSWEVPSGKTRFYKETEEGNLIRADDGRGKLKEWAKDYTFKIILKRYENKATRNADEEGGQFQKKIYTGLKGCTRIGYAIVTYSWHSGRPWNFVPSVPKEPGRKTNWEKKSYEKVNMTSMPQMVSAFYEGFNIYSHCVINYDEACSIMLGATVVDSNKLCSSVPIGYRQNGTFVIDLKRMGHCLLELRRDENGLWNKPSGFSRFYKLEENGDAVRVDKAGKLPALTDYDVKISSKRYEHTQVDKKFVRKIYTAKGKNTETFPGSPEYAVIVYYWKGDPIPFEPIYKQNLVHVEAKDFNKFQQIAEEDEEFVEATAVAPEIEIDPQPELEEAHEPQEKRARYQTEASQTMIEMKMNLIRREMENQDRFAGVLDRAEALLTRMEQRIGVEHVYAAEAVPEEWHEEEIIEEEVIHDVDHY